jgi:CRISPR type I-E-associated protein CasB/Cse2
MAKLTARGPWFWTAFDPEDRSAGADTATLRKGLGREAGSVPELWRYYRVVVPDQVAAAGWITSDLTAEHAALTLFALHQQSQSTSMHRDGEHIGAALLKLRGSDQFTGNPDALDRRIGAAATATSVQELVFHLRGLVTLLRGQKLPLDYSQLAQDVADWRTPFGQARARRRWGANYFAWNRKSADNDYAPQTVAQ